MNLSALLKSNIGRLRILGFVEGMSLIVLVCIAVPLKYGLDAPGLVRAVGPVHGVLFIVFVAKALLVAFVHRWKLTTTAIVLVSCLIPFATFYVDKKILKPAQA